MKTIRQNIRNLSKEQFEKLRSYSKHSNSLYNCGIWICKKYFEETGKYIGLPKLYQELKENEHFTSILAVNSQQIIRLIDKNYRAFFASLKRKRNGEYAMHINSPSFQKSGNQFILIFTNQAFTLKNNILKLYKWLKLPFTYQINGELKQAIIKWNGTNYQLTITYEEIKKLEKEKDNQRYLSIDLGLNNLAACFSNVGPSFIVNGKPLKSYNQFYNKEKAKIQSKLEICNKKKWSKKLSIITQNRNNWFNNYLWNAVSQIIKYSQKNEINTIICGYNEGWKQKINLGKRTNQKFVMIPHRKLIDKLRNKCEYYGLNFILTEESYTSKCSFIDNEPLQKKDIYKGKRIKRGLFKTYNNMLVNADINGAANIMRKVVSNLKTDDEIVASIVKPKMLNLFNSLKNYYMI